MPRFRKKPVEIEAWQFQLFAPKDAAGVCRGACGINTMPHVHTIHGADRGPGQLVFLADGDWIVPEADGVHHYPIKPDVFAKTYEPVS